MSNHAATDCPEQIREFADQAVRYVQSALDLELEYNSDTLPIIDHYLRSVPEDQAATLALVITTSGAYFGEVIRRALGGHWDLSAGDPTTWRLVLPGGISFVPAGIVAAVIARQDDIDGVDQAFDVPPKMRPAVEAILGRMAEVTEDEYYSLGGRFDTLEHLQATLLAMAASRQPDSTDAN